MPRSPALLWSQVREGWFSTLEPGFWILDSGQDRLLLHLYIFFWGYSIPRPKLVYSIEFVDRDEITLQFEEIRRCGGKTSLWGALSCKS